MEIAHQALHQAANVAGNLSDGTLDGDDLRLLEQQVGLVRQAVIELSTVIAELGGAT